MNTRRLTWCAPPGASLWRYLLVAVVCFAGASCLWAAEASLLGATRAEAEAQLGQPTSVLKRGGSEVLVFSDGVRIELHDGRVVSIRGGNFGEIVAADGTRYVVDEQGQLRDIAAQVTAVERPPKVEEASTGRAESLPVDAHEVPQPAEEVTAETDEDWRLVEAAENPEQLLANDPELAGLLALESTQAAESESEQTGWVGKLIGVVLHLGFLILILAITLHWVGVPFMWPDLTKVALLALAVREGLHGLGALGGNWQLIQLFRVDEAVSFFALAILLFRFKVALSGLTALKVAAATKLVTYLLMIMVGVAISFAL